MSGFSVKNVWYPRYQDTVVLQLCILLAQLTDPCTLGLLAILIFTFVIAIGVFGGGAGGRLPHRVFFMSSIRAKDSVLLGQEFSFNSFSSFSWASTAA